MGTYFDSAFVETVTGVVMIATLLLVGFNDLFQERARFIHCCRDI